MVARACPSMVLPSGLDAGSRLARSASARRTWPRRSGFYARRASQRLTRRLTGGPVHRHRSQPARFRDSVESWSDCTMGLQGASCRRIDGLCRPHGRVLPIWMRRSALVDLEFLQPEFTGATPRLITQLYGRKIVVGRHISLVHQVVEEGQYVD